MWLAVSNAIWWWSSWNWSVWLSVERLGCPKNFCSQIVPCIGCRVLSMEAWRVSWMLTYLGRLLITRLLNMLSASSWDKDILLSVWQMKSFRKFITLNWWGCQWEHFDRCFQLFPILNILLVIKAKEEFIGYMLTIRTGGMHWSIKDLLWVFILEEEGFCFE